MKNINDELIILILSFIPFNIRKDFSIISKKFYKFVYKYNTLIDLNIKNVKTKKLNEAIQLIKLKFNYDNHNFISNIQLNGFRREIEDYDLFYKDFKNLKQLSIQKNSNFEKFEVNKLCYLEYLELSNLKNFKEIVFKDDINQKTIKRLNLSLTLIGDKVVELLTTKLVNLEEIILKACVNLKKPKFNSKKLTHINIRSCKNIEKIKILNKKIKYLNLHGTNINDVTLDKLLNKIKNDIEYLEIRNCKNILFNNDYLFSFEMKNLNNLNVGRTNINDYFVIEFLKNCKKLYKLDASICLNVKEIIIDFKINLRYLFFDDCTNLEKFKCFNNHDFEKLNIENTKFALNNDNIE
jgi:hypothetical protein